MDEGQPQVPYQQRPSWPKAYSAGLIFGGCFLAFAGLYFVLGRLDGKSWLELWTGFFENQQSESFQSLITAVVLAYFYFWGSSQSKESQDRIEARQQLILHELAEIRKDLQTAAMRQYELAGKGEERGRDMHEVLSRLEQLLVRTDRRKAPRPSQTEGTKA